MGTAKTLNFSKSKGHTFVKYCSIYYNNKAKFTYSYTKFVYQISFICAASPKKRNGNCI